MKRKHVKTIPIDRVSDPFICPIHHETIEQRVRRESSDDGRDELKGVYYGCPAYAECRYYVNADMTVVADVGQSRLME